MFNIRAWGPALLLLALFIAVLLMPAKANTPYKFLDDRTQAGNDQQRLLNTVVTHYGMTRERLSPSSSPSARWRPSCPSSCSWPTSPASRWRPSSGSGAPSAWTGSTSCGRAT